MQYDNTNSGLLTKADKGDNPQRPDYRGSININGVDYWLSAWIQVGREGTKLAGQKYMSLKANLKEEQAAKPAPKPEAGDDPFDDSIPF